VASSSTVAALYGWSSFIVVTEPKTLNSIVIVVTSFPWLNSLTPASNLGGFHYLKGHLHGATPFGGTFLAPGS
jgi:hypothetical protein